MAEFNNMDIYIGSIQVTLKAKIGARVYNCICVNLPSRGKVEIWLQLGHKE